METPESLPSLRYDNLVASPRGLGEAHRNKIVLFVRATEIEQILLRFGHSSHRPVLSTIVGLIFLPIGLYGLYECLFTLGGLRYEIALIGLGIIGGSLVHDTLKRRFYLEVHHRKSHTARLICSRKATVTEVRGYCTKVSEAFHYQITDKIDQSHS